MDRRSFLALGAGVPVLGSLLLAKPTILTGEAPPELGDQKLYVPEEPVIIAATSIERPIFETGLRVKDWRIDAYHPPMDVSSWADRERRYVMLPPTYEITLSGYLSEPFAALDTLGSGNATDPVTSRYRLYLVPDREDPHG